AFSIVRSGFLRSFGLCHWFIPALDDIVERLLDFGFADLINAVENLADVRQRERRPCSIFAHRGNGFASDAENEEPSFSAATDRNDSSGNNRIAKPLVTKNGS